MKRWIYILSLTLVGTLSLTACPGGGKGGSASTPGPGAGGNNGGGTPVNQRNWWDGGIQVDQAGMAQLFSDAGQCSGYGYGCRFEGVYLNLRTEADGSGSMELRSFRHRQWNMRVRLATRPTATANGFEMVGYIQGGFHRPLPPIPPTQQQCYWVWDEPPRKKRNWFFGLSLSGSNGSGSMFLNGGNGNQASNGRYVCDRVAPQPFATQDMAYSDSSSAPATIDPNQQQMAATSPGPMPGWRGNEVRVVAERLNNGSAYCLRVTVYYGGRVIGGGVLKDAILNY